MVLNRAFLALDSHVGGVNMLDKIGLRIPLDVAHHSEMISPTHSEMMSPTIPG